MMRRYGLQNLVIGFALVSVALLSGCFPDDQPESASDSLGQAPQTRITLEGRQGQTKSRQSRCGRFSRRDLTSLRDFVRTNDSVVSFPRSSGSPSITTIGRLSAPYARSTIKVVILTALIKAAGGHQELSADEAGNARLAIENSDNNAARAIYESLARRVGGQAPAANAMTTVLRSAGDMQTSVPVRLPDGLPPSFISSYGATLWTPRSQVVFMKALASGKLVDRNSTDYVLSLMGRVTPEGGSTWGLGTLVPPVEAEFKPGWGDNPDGQYLARQMGLLTISEGNDELVVAVASLGTSQDLAYARQSAVAQGIADTFISSCP